MPRVKRGTIAHKKRERTLRNVKGFKWGRKSKERLAKEALLHAWSHAYTGRKQKKRNARRLWQIKINASARTYGISYSKLMAALKKQNIELDRKILSTLAEHYPSLFEAVAKMQR